MSDIATTDFDQDTPPEPMPRPAATTAPGNFVDDGGVEIDPNEALTEAQSGASPTIPAPEQAQAPREDVVDVLRPKAAPRTWRIGPEDLTLEFIQHPLSFIGKMQWFALVGEVMDKAMSGENGVSVNELLSSPDARGGQFSLADFRDADNFVRAIAKLVAYSPMFITDSYCIWLGVPEHQRKLVSTIMAAPETDGGLSDNDGLEMIEVFIDQNYDALADFFGDKIGALQRRVVARQTERKGRLEMKGARR